jgi:hypothetical protein
MAGLVPAINVLLQQDRQLLPTPSNQRLIQIMPFGVHGHYKPYFPGSGPMFDAAFALNGRPNIVVKFKPDEPLEAVALCEPLDETVPMFERPSQHVARHAGV